MPTIRPSRPCRAYRCPCYQVADGYCEEHQHLVRRRGDDDRPAASERGYDRAWHRLRMSFLRRYPLCARCGAPAEIAHHVHPLRDGGERLDEENLMSLCRRCHAAEHGGRGGDDE